MDTSPVTPTGAPIPVPSTSTTPPPSIPTPTPTPTPAAPMTPPTPPVTPEMPVMPGQSSGSFMSLPKRTTFFIAALALITVFLLYLAITQYPAGVKKTSVTPKPTPTPVAQTILSLELQPATSSSRMRTVDVHIDSGGNEVTAVQLELSFDPAAFSTVTATPASFFANPDVLFKDLNMKTGNLTYALGITPTQQPVKGSGTVIELQFVPAASASGSTIVKILPKSLVTAKGVVQSVLKLENQVTIPLTMTTITAVPSLKPVITTAPATQSAK